MTALAAIHVAKRELELDDETYRAVLVRVTGKDSAKGMTSAEHDAVLDEFRRLGFKGASKRPQRRLEGPYARKAQALWIALFNLGAVADKRDAALLAFVERQTGIQRTEWLRDAEQGAAVIEALKKIAERHGVCWTVTRRTAQVARQHGYQIASAQWGKLTGAVMATSAFWSSVSDIIGRRVTPDTPPSHAEWQRVMNVFGERIRRQDKLRESA